MREYEFVYVIQPDATPEREAEIHQRIDTVVSDQKGRFLLRDDWGKRRLAYEIKKFQICGDREVVNGDPLLEDVGDGSSHLLIHFAIEPLRAKQGHFLEGLSGIKEEAP